MEKDEKRLKQEDCNEDNLGSGILTLTNKRLAFDKTQSRIMDFSKRFGDTVLDVELKDVCKRHGCKFFVAPQRFAGDCGSQICWTGGPLYIH